MTSTDATGSPAPTSAAQRGPVDLRHLVTSPIMDQGARPLCVPFALSFAHEAAAGDAMAPEAIWWACFKMGLVGAQGMILDSGGKALSMSGQPHLKDWPWNPYLGAGSEEPASTAGRPPWNLARFRSLTLAHDGVEDDLESHLAASRPVVLVVEVVDEFDNPGPDGFIKMPDIRSPIGDYHAVLVVGAAHNAAGVRHLLIRNSWSVYWGAGGYGWLPVDYLIANAGPAAVVTV